jgi:hypothetical protein
VIIDGINGKWTDGKWAIQRDPVYYGFGSLGCLSCFCTCNYPDCNQTGLETIQISEAKDISTGKRSASIASYSCAANTG